MSIAFQLRQALTMGAAAAAAGMELNDFLALDPHTREFLRKTLNEDAKALMAELGNDPNAKGMHLRHNNINRNNNSSYNNNNKKNNNNKNDNDKKIDKKNDKNNNDNKNNNNGKETTTTKTTEKNNNNNNNNGKRQ